MEIIIIPHLGALTLTVVADDGVEVDLAVRWRRALKALSRRHGLRVIDFTEGRMERRVPTETYEAGAI